MIQPPNPDWLPFLKIGLGYFLVAILFILAMGIAMGKVEAASSFGLDTTLGSLFTLAGAFAGWAFGKSQ